MATRKITCRCGSSEEFTVVWEIRVVTNIDAYGQPEDSTEYANETGRCWINCRGCGHSWRTTRHFDLPVDVR